MEKTLQQKLAERFHIESYPPEEQEAILDEASVIVMTGVISKAIPLIPDEYAAECDTIVSGDADIVELFQFLSDKVPTFESIVDEEMGLLEKTLA